MTTSEALTGQVIGQLRLALTPAMNDITLDWHCGQPTTTPAPEPTTTTPGNLLNFQQSPAADRGAIQAPFVVPPVHSGSRFIVYRITPPGTPPPTHVTVSASTPAGPLAATIASSASAAGAWMMKLAVRALVRDLQESRSYEHSRRGFNACVVIESGIR